jgi:hypothetical protein
MLKTSTYLLALATVLCLGSQAFAGEGQPFGSPSRPGSPFVAEMLSHGGAQGPVLPQRNRWSHIYNGAIHQGHDAALARAEANLICGG